MMINVQEKVEKVEAKLKNNGQNPVNESEKNIVTPINSKADFQNTSNPSNDPSLYASILEDKKPYISELNRLKLSKSLNIEKNQKKEETFEENFGKNSTMFERKNVVDQATEKKKAKFENSEKTNENYDDDEKFISKINENIVNFKNYKIIVKKSNCQLVILIIQSTKISH